MNIALWIAQGVLAAVFVSAGLMKLTQSKASLEVRPGMGYMTELSALQLHLIGSAEVLGSVGLMLPWWLGRLPALTPLAAAALVVLMVGATMTHVRRKEPIAFTSALGALAAFVAIGRGWALI
jgi:uncharacterized membrane protein YphA (DoxX/SURF4 family)